MMHLEAHMEHIRYNERGRLNNENYSCTFFLCQAQYATHLHTKILDKILPIP